MKKERPSIRINQIIKEHIEFAKEQNKDNSMSNLPKYNENREHYIILSIIEYLDEQFSGNNESVNIKDTKTSGTTN